MRRVFDPSAGAFQRKWLTMAWRSVLCGAGMVLTAPVMALADSAPFSIATQPMPTALKSFAAQAHMQLLYQYNAVAKLMGNAVNGQLEKRVALELLLRNTGLEAVYSSDDSATIRPANALASPTPPSSQNPSADKATPISYAAPAEAPPPNPPQAAPSAPTEPPASQSNTLEQVVVTGTLIRGIAPAGANVISVDAQQIAATSPSGGNNLLNNTIPQLSEFNNTNINITAVNTQVTVDRPNLRNLPGLGTAGDSTTLILLDGHRLVGSGITETAPDPDIIPPAMIERIEVIPDGGSATYGSDAVGGVINFITRRRFDGVQVDGHAGFADNYHYYDANLTAGRDWGSGSAYVSYSYTDHTPVFGYDRDYVRHYGLGGRPAQDLNCVPGNVSTNAGSITYALPGLLPNTANYCDTSKNSSFINRQQRNSVFAGVSEDFTEGLKFDLRAYYTDQIQNNYGDFTSGSAITAANPYYERVASNPAPQAALPETVYFDWGPVLGTNASRSQTTLSSWGVTPTLSFDIGQTGWQLREMINYGGSLTKVDNTALNPTAQALALASTNPQTALDPYNIAATNPSVISNIANYEFYARSRQQLINERLVADGGLVPLPGGDVHLAVGGEYIHEKYDAMQGNFVPGTEGTVPFTDASRNSEAAFSELAIPVFSDKNALPGIAALSLNAAVRYDHYSDFGGTTNPQFALTYKPVDWLKLRGKWGSSFIAPSLADTNAINNSLLIIPAFIYPDVLPGKFSPNQAQWPLIALQGGLPNLRAQTAHTAEAGADITLPFDPDVKFTVTYYHITFNQIVSTPDVSNPFDFYTNYTQSYILNPTQAQVTALASQVRGGLAQVAPLFVPGALPIYILEDDRRQNLGNAKVDGLDFGANFKHATDFGSIDASFNGTYALQALVQATSSSPFANELDLDTSRLSFVANAGTNVGAFRAQATVTYSSGFQVTPTSANGFQQRVGSFALTNLFLRYDFSQIGGPALLTNNLVLTFAINNLFDRDPPLYRGAYNSIYNGYANGATVGRLFEVGVSKKF
jgi:iron complex outermembrane receptor protein